jgi:outer membrane protein assembly factor BamD
MIVRIFSSLVLFLFVLSGCSGYNKVVKGDNYERKFELANELYDGKHYMRSVTLYEQVYQRVPKTGEGELAYYRIGKSYFAEEDFSMAGYYFSSFYSRFPFSTKAEETLFLSAMCSVANSPEFSLDQTDTEIAINDLQQFIDKFPNSGLIDSCNHVMDRLWFKLETKDFYMVQQYAKTGSYKSAISTGLTFLEDYPRSKFKEEVHYLVVKNSYLLTKNSIEQKKKQRIEETIERYRTFVGEFPSTKYKKEIGSMSDEMEKGLQNYSSLK